MVDNDTFPRTENDASLDPTTRLERRLTLIFLLWPVVSMVAWLPGLSSFARYWIYYPAMFLSPVLAVILIGVAWHHHPILHRFLKIVVALSLIVLVLTNFTCANTASHGDLLQVLTNHYHLYQNRTPIEDMVYLYTHSVVTLPSFVNDYDILSLSFTLMTQHYSVLTGPLFLLFLLITPRFLALPVFWLWLVLSVLYVVLPSRAWRWIGNTLRSVWTAVRQK